MWVPSPPCGRPSWPILASEFRCNCPGGGFQGNCIKLGQTHVRLPESGRGAPCGRPSQGITPRTVQIVVRYRKFQTSLATGGRFLGRKMKTIGRGTPCGCPLPLVGALRRLLWRPNLDAIALGWICIEFGGKVRSDAGLGKCSGPIAHRFEVDEFSDEKVTELIAVVLRLLDSEPELT